MPDVHLLLGDCREKLTELPDATVDSVVTDPPYEIGFMGKHWDNSGIAYDVEMWREVLRVLKPGGHLLAFGGTRTYHRMACAIEDAGFEIRDQMQWLYGSGFPKSLDVSKAIDKAAGAERDVVGFYQYPTDHPRPNKDMQRWAQRLDEANARSTVKISPGAGNKIVTAPATHGHRAWQGWGTALKPANEPICVARKPLSESTVAKNVLKHGTGAINIDGCRIAHASSDDLAISQAKNPGRDDEVTSGVYGANRPQQSVNVSGRWPANVVISHPEGCRLVGMKKVKPANGSGIASDKGGGFSRGIFGDGSSDGIGGTHLTSNGTETVESWECEEGCAVRILDEQSGTLKSGALDRSRITAPNKTYGAPPKELTGTYQPNIGGASRFFYCAKASRSERNTGCEDLPFTWTPGGEPTTNRSGKTNPMSHPDGLTTSTSGNTTPNRGNVHPTVKPVALMRYLCRLVTPPGGTVLDPFMGSGTTGIAAVSEGFSLIGIELDATYFAIAEKRIEEAQERHDNESQQNQLPLAA